VEPTGDPRLSFDVAAHVVLTTASRALTRRFLIDEEVLRRQVVTDFGRYAKVRDGELLPDFFV
jgi:hypothetical protein